MTSGGEADRTYDAGPRTPVRGFIDIEDAGVDDINGFIRDPLPNRFCSSFVPVGST